MNSVSEQYSTRLISSGGGNGDSKHDTTAYTLVPSIDADLQGGPVEQKPVTLSGSIEEVLSGNTFQTLIAGVIVANAVVIGLETDCPGVKWWPLLENSFLVIFTVELLLRMFVQGLTFWRSKTEFGWNMFDLVVVFFGLVDFWIAQQQKDGEKKKTGKYMVLRVFRLLRILRIFRLFRMLKQLYILASGFVEATTAIFWVSFLTAICLYICAIMLTRLLGHPAEAALRKGSGSGEDETSNLFLLAHFGDIKASMFTLFELMAHPNIEEYQVVIANDPYMKVFFVLFVIFCSFAMLSLLTGVISETMIEKSQMRKEEMKVIQEQKRNLFLEQLRAVFQAADADRSGSLSKSEFRSCVSQIIGVLEEEGVAITEEELQSVFDMIDFDGSGSIEVDEFLSGMQQITKELRAADIMEIQYSIRKVTSDVLTKVDDSHNNLSLRLNTIETRIEQIVNALRNADQPGGGPGGRAGQIGSRF